MSISSKTELDIKKFITILTNKNQLIILNVSSKNVIRNICHTYHLIYLLDKRYDTSSKPNTYSRDSGRIDFILVSKRLKKYITNIGILPFGDLVFSDHRPMFLDINL